MLVTKPYGRLEPSSDYRIDYHTMQPARDEPVIGAMRRLMAGARVPVDYEVLEGMVHGFLTMGGKVDAANRAVSMVADALKGMKA